MAGHADGNTDQGHLICLHPTNEKGLSESSQLRALGGETDGIIQDFVLLRNREFWGSRIFSIAIVYPC